MSLFISKVINSAIQIILFALIPFIWWLVTARKECSFFEWIGLKRPRAGESDKPLLWVAGTSAVFLIVSLFVLYSVKNVETATSEFTGLSVNAIPAILVYAFRGFLLKRIANKTGFAIGNLIQAVLFGLMHGVLFFSSVGTIKAILITLFTGFIGWLMVFINEKKTDGSILPGWLIHSIANIFSGLSAAFGLFL